jgi:hypothetical protein
MILRALALGKLNISIAQHGRATRAESTREALVPSHYYRKYLQTQDIHKKYIAQLNEPEAITNCESRNPAGVSPDEQRPSN